MRRRHLDHCFPIYSDELTLANCLNSIPGITFTIDGEPVTIGFTGNVEVSRTTEGSYYVTFCNELAGLNPPLLTFNTAGVTAYTYDFDITQFHTGNIDLTTPMQTGMVQLRNVSGADESSDPYNVNFASSWDGIVNKAEWPTWRTPQAMIAREAAKGNMLPDEMEGGPANPLGARALYIGGSIYRIHGTNSPGSIGGAVSSGCIRMMNADVIELYERVKVGAKVHVFQ